MEYAVVFDEQGHVDYAVQRYATYGDEEVDQLGEGMTAATYDGDLDDIQFCKLGNDGQTLEIDEEYREQKKAEMEKSAAERDQAATLKNTQLQTAAALYVRSAGFARMDAINVSTLYDDWSGGGVQYKKGQWLRYGGDLYQVESDHTSQADWKPDVSPSLYTRFRLAPDGIRIWETPTHAENAFDTGERCHYPDADGRIWVSKIDGNTTVPGSDERWWEPVEQ